MTGQPPPPPGNYPPPPPPGGYPPPPGPQGGFPPPPPQWGPGYPPPPAVDTGLPKEAYTPWLTRVWAFLIDYIPVAIVSAIAWVVWAGTRETACITDTSEYDLGEFCATGASTMGQATIYVIAPLVSLAYVLWNFGYRQGTTGSSIGKSIMKFKVVSEKTGQPIGFGLSFVRELIYIVAAFATCGILWLVAVLFPLWDQKRQSLADKIVSTICVPL